MVRVIAELSANTPASSSMDRYRFRYGYGSGDCGAFIYKRPAPIPEEKVPEKQVETIPLLVLSGGDDDDVGERGREIINSNLAKINETNTRVSMMVEIRRNMHKLQEKQETQQMREINEKSEKEKREREQREQEERRKQEQEKEERRKKQINSKLGKIIYKTRNGGVFEAHHSIHMTVKSVYDRKMGDTVQTYTEKIIWNDQVFETKQDWFSEMNKLNVAEADSKMQIVRYD
jgi:hypothetical protein